MKWFKHVANASDDDFIEELEESLGLAGYARWWKLLESIAKGMAKNPTEPSATHLISKWKKIFSAYHMKEVVEFLNFCLRRDKIRVYLGELSTGVVNEDRGVSVLDLSSISAQSTTNVIKIVCPNILKLRDEYNRKSGESPDTLRSETAKKQKKKERYNPLPLFPSPLPAPGDQPTLPGKIPIPVPQLNGQTHHEESFKSDISFAAAAAACRTLLGLRDLSDLDKSLLASWMEMYDFKTFVLPNMEAATQNFMENNFNKRPATLSYFSPRLRERASK